VTGGKGRYRKGREGKRRKGKGEKGRGSVIRGPQAGRCQGPRTGKRRACP